MLRLHDENTATSSLHLYPRPTLAHKQNGNSHTKLGVREILSFRLVVLLEFCIVFIGKSASAIGVILVCPSRHISYLGVHPVGSSMFMKTYDTFHGYIK
jgi:hypothetical protein